jgi:hypothetical protein
MCRSAEISAALRPSAARRATSTSRRVRESIPRGRRSKKSPSTRLSGASGFSGCVIRATSLVAYRRATATTTTVTTPTMMRVGRFRASATRLKVNNAAATMATPDAARLENSQPAAIRGINASEATTVEGVTTSAREMIPKMRQQRTAAAGSRASRASPFGRSKNRSSVGARLTCRAWRRRPSAPPSRSPNPADHNSGRWHLAARKWPVIGRRSSRSPPPTRTDLLQLN